jgi:hypothetical protein
MLCWSNPVFSAVRTIIGWPSCRPVTCCRTNVCVRKDIHGIPHFLHRYSRSQTLQNPHLRLSSLRWSVSFRFIRNRPCVTYICHISAACRDHVLVTGFITTAISAAEKLWRSFLRPRNKSHNLLSNTLSLKAGYFRNNSINMSERFQIVTPLALP